MTGLFSICFLVGYVNASIEISAATDKPIFQAGEYVTVSITAYNPTSETITLSFGTSKQVTYIMDDTYDWSDDKVFAPALTYRVISPYSSYTWNLVHDFREFESYPLLIGEHSVIAIVLGYGQRDPIQFQVIPNRPLLDC